jgi:hypothetical protein
MYVRGYLQGSENGRVVTIDRNTDEVWWRYGIDEVWWRYGINRSCDEWCRRHSSKLRLIPYLHHIVGEKRTHPRFADWCRRISSIFSTVSLITWLMTVIITLILCFANMMQIWIVKRFIGFSKQWKRRLIVLHYFLLLQPSLWL